MHQVLQEPKRANPAASGPTHKNADERQAPDDEKRNSRGNGQQSTNQDMGCADIQPATRGQDDLHGTNRTGKQSPRATIATQGWNTNMFGPPGKDPAGEKPFQMAIRKQRSNQLNPDPGNKRSKIVHPMPIH